MDADERAALSVPTPWERSLVRFVTVARATARVARLPCGGGKLLIAGGGDGVVRFEDVLSEETLETLAALQVDAVSASDVISGACVLAPSSWVVICGSCWTADAIAKVAARGEVDLVLSVGAEATAATARALLGAGEGGHYLSHRYDAMTMSLVSCTVAPFLDSGDPRTHHHIASDIFVWLSSASAALIAACTERCAAFGDGVMGTVAPNQLAGQLPALQLALSRRRTLYAVALLRPGSGVAVDTNDVVLAATRSSDGVDGQRPPLGWLFDGCGPVLVCELLLALWRCAAFGGEVGDVMARLPPVGELHDDPDVMESVAAELEAALRSVEGSGDGIDRLRRLIGLLDTPANLSDLAVSRLLGLRLTLGSRTAVAGGAVPPSLPQLIDGFDSAHCFGQVMSVGARALTKHHHRDETTSWWIKGPLKGTQDEKNSLATQALCRVLRDRCWANVHVLPHDIVTFELRCAAGYGARWVLGTLVPAASEAGSGGDVTSLGTELQFRGFLEPQDADGHEKGWRH